jgi:tetratricopeptide (TPR) repeat protein
MKGTRDAAMPSGHGERYDFFLSRRGSVAAIAQEVEQVLAEKGYSVLTQDYDIPLASSFIEKMHEGVINSRDLIVLFTHDYLQSPYTRKEFTSFEADRVKTTEQRHIIVLRCEDVPVRGLLADNVYQDLVGIGDPGERKRRIIAAAERHSQAAPPPPRPFIGVPPRIASFTGRADELDRLDAILMHDKPAAVTQASVGRAAVQGMGGVGKTSLAIEYAHRYRDLYAGVCWCPAETRVGLLGALTSLAVSLGAATAEEGDIEKAAKAALRRLAEQRATWLLVYDNVTAPDEVADLLPSAGARVLITSRFSDWGELAGDVPLDLLPLEEAVAYLQSRAARSDAVGAKILAEALGRLPLALDHAAAYCKRAQMRFADYVAKVSRFITLAPRGAGYPTSVGATFDLAIEAAAAECPEAEALISYLAQCAPERIPMTLLEGAFEQEAEVWAALTALSEISLVKHDPFENGTPAIVVHRLVQNVARTRSEANKTSATSTKRLISRLSAIYPQDRDALSDNAPEHPKSWPVCAQLTPHVLVQRHSGSATTEMPQWAELLHLTGCYLFGRGSYSEAVQLLRDAFAMRERLLGPEHVDTAGTLGQLASLLRAQGDLSGAQEHEERVLSIREKALGRDHIHTATSLNNLALLLSDQGDLAGARPLYDRAIAIYEQALGPEHPWTAACLLNLARLLRAQKDMLGAKPIFNRVLAIDEKTLGPNHPGTAATLLNFGLLLLDQGDLVGARKTLERSVTIFEQSLGAEHPDTAEALSSLADILRAEKDFVRARELYERVLEINERALGPDHFKLGTTLNNLGFTLQAIGDFSEARPLYLRALPICEKALGPSHRTTNRVRYNMASLLLATDQPTEALCLGEVALAAHDKALGRDHAWTKDSARLTADALDALGRPEEAKALREKYGLTDAEKSKDS